MPRILANAFRKGKGIPLSKNRRTLINVIILLIIIAIVFGYIALHGNKGYFVTIVSFFIILGVPVLIGANGVFVRKNESYFLQELLKIELRKTELRRELQSFNTEKSKNVLNIYYEFLQRDSGSNPKEV